MADGSWLGNRSRNRDRARNWGLGSGIGGSRLGSCELETSGSTDQGISAGTLSLIDCSNVETPLSRAEPSRDWIWIWNWIRVRCIGICICIWKPECWKVDVVALSHCICSPRRNSDRVVSETETLSFDVEVEVFRAPPIDSQFHGAHWFWSATTGAPAGRWSAPATPPDPPPTPLSPLKRPWTFASPIPRLPSRRKFYWQRQLAARASRFWDRSQWVADEYSLLALVWIKWIKRFRT